MKSNPIVTLAPMLLLSGLALSQTLPEPPAIWREVTGVKYQNPLATGTLTDESWSQNQRLHMEDSPLQPRHTRAHVPAFRTSADGRIAIKTLGSGPCFTLLKPEKLQQHVSLIQAAPVGGPGSAPEINKENSFVMSQEGYTSIQTPPPNSITTPLPRQQGDAIYKPIPSGFGGGHWTLYDPTPNGLQPGTGNPKNLNGKDVYDLKIVGGAVSSGGLKFCVSDVKVTVTDPKTADARIESVVRQGDPVYGPLIEVDDPNCFELNIAAEGRLLVLRIGPNKSFSWTDPTTGVAGNPSNLHNIVYSYYEGGVPADPTKWTSIFPITHAPYDARINGTVAGKALGFALSKFRDPAGNEFADGIGFGATYPWIDRDAKNLFFTTMNDTFKWGSAVGQSRYSYMPSPGQITEPQFNDASGSTQGVSFMGLWSHGKMVQLDNLLNDMDPLLGPVLFMRDVNLFNTGGYLTPPVVLGPAWSERQNLTMGGNRVNANGHMPFGDSRNSTIIDSLVNTFNYRKNVAPLTLRDVVWPMQNPRHNADVSFDDYTDYDAFIISHMNGHISADAAGNFKHWSGWNGTTKAFEVVNTRMQNSACPPSSRWRVPAYGQVTGTGSRLEPAASGGFQGKGFWMGGSSGVKFSVVTQPTPSKISGNHWYVGLFVDCRFPSGSNIERDLLTFPDGSRIVMYGADSLFYLTPSGSHVGTVNLLNPIPNPNGQVSLLPDPGWSHLAWQIRHGGKTIDFLLDGMLHTRITVANPIFQFIAGDMVVGKNATNPGFRGWVDEFKVLAHEVDPETACNHAGGTLVGMSQAYAGEFRAIANTYPNSNSLAKTEINNRLANSGETGYNNYANFRNYDKDNGGSLVELEAVDENGIRVHNGLTSLRKAIHFPEGPIFHNRPRPDSTRNQFCMTCHIPGGAPGLTDSALTPIAGLNASADGRRQPSQPPPRLFGNIPAGLIDNTALSGLVPITATEAPTGGSLIDGWMQPTFSAVTVKSFTLVDVTDATNPIDVQEIRANNPTIKCNASKTYQVRVNLDSAQGKVNVTHTLGTGISTSYPNKIFPYTIPLLNQVGAHTIVADPELTGTTRTLTFSVSR